MGENMVSSNTEAACILEPLISKFNHLFGENKLEEMSHMYGKDAVMITKGKGAVYGREAIKEGLAEFTAQGKIFTHMPHQSVIGIRDHIILRANFEAVILETKEVIRGKFEQIFRLEGDEWLIIFDEFQEL